jgi:hypothetical protein
VGSVSGPIAVEIPARSANAAAWNAFAIACGGSFRSERRHLRGWAAKHIGRYRLRLFELRSGAGAGAERIGQCAVGVGRHDSMFLDRPLLAPGGEPRWTDAVDALLAKLGPGRYRYGWELNMEPDRTAELAEIGGVTIASSRPITVQAIDFSGWPDWPSYWRSISNNVRRNVKKARSEIPDLDLVTRRGPAAVRSVPDLIRLRSVMYDRKGIRFRAAGATAAAVGSALVGSGNAFVSIACGDGRPLAALSGVDFGPNTYYLDGGSRSDNQGASWYLLTESIRSAYDADPQGRFVMGYVDHATHDESVGGGLLRSRQSCRVSDYPTAMVTFDHAG